MNLRIIGCVLVFLSCAGCGWSMAAAYQKQERALRELAQGLELMELEMKNNLTPLPQLCRSLSRACRGSIGRVFRALEAELTGPNSVAPGVGMLRAVQAAGDVPDQARELLLRLGGSLGQYDLDGQLTGISLVLGEARRKLARLEVGREGRLRSYRTLGICCGAALAILLI